MTRASIVALIPTLIAFAVAMIGGSAGAAPRSLWFQSEAPEIVELATGPLGETTLGLSGRNLYSQDGISLVGFLSSVAGLGPADLFTAEARSVETARFTYVADVSVASTANRADTTTTVGAGVLRIYFAEDGGASWDDLASFADGQQVAEYELDLRETLQRQAPGVGVAVGDGRAVQSIAETLTIGDETFQFGLIGIEERLRYVGAPLPDATSGLPSSIGLTGSVTVTRREAIYAEVGDPGLVSTPTAQNGVCAVAQPWLRQTEDALAQARAAGSVVDVRTAIDAIDAGAVRQGADSVASLAATQRGIVVPEGAAEANRLVVTALSTYARGLRTVADAADADDAELLGLGQVALQDGDSLLGRAEGSVAAFSADCVATEGA